MQKYKSNIITTTGLAQRNISVRVLDDNGALAALYADRYGQTPIANPQVTAVDGTFAFYAANGRYSLQTTINGVTYTDQDVVLAADPEDMLVAGPIADAVNSATASVLATATGAASAAQASQSAAASSAGNAATSEANALASRNAAASSAGAALISEGNTLANKNASDVSASAAATSASNAATSESNALASRNAAATAAANAATYAQGYANGGVYGAGVMLSDRFTFLAKDGELYRLADSVALPYTTTGDWASESSKFVSIGDRNLRSDLAATVPASGSALVGFTQNSAGAVARTVEQRLRDTVSVKDFGAVGDGVTDDTAAVQAAIDYAFSAGRAVCFKNGDFYITQILLPQNSAEPVQPLYLIGENARIIVKGTDVVFTVNGNFFYDLYVSGLIFIGQASGNFAAVDSKLFDCGKIIRLIVDSCSSVYVNTFFYTPAGAYAQSVYAHKCIYRGGSSTGYFFEAQIAFDVSLTDCLVEQSYNGLRVVAPAASGNLQQLSRVTIRGGAWESLFGTAIAVGPCFQFTVDTVYFEGNDTDINLSYNATEADHLGVTITNNDFYQSNADITAGKFNVIWGANATQSYRTGGNKTNGRLHDITGSLGVFDFTGDYAGIQLYNGMNSQNVRTGNTPVGRTTFKTKEADWVFSGNDAIALIPSLSAIEMGRIANADLVNGRVIRPRIAFGSLNPQTNPAAYNNVEWCRGSFVHNSLPEILGSAGARYVVTGWCCISSGYAGSDVWQELRALTGS